MLAIGSRWRSLAPRTARQAQAVIDRRALALRRSTSIFLFPIFIRLFNSFAEPDTRNLLLRQFPIHPSMLILRVSIRVQAQKSLRLVRRVADSNHCEIKFQTSSGGRSIVALRDHSAACAETNKVNHSQSSPLLSPMVDLNERTLCMSGLLSSTARSLSLAQPSQRPPPTAGGGRGEEQGYRLALTGGCLCTRQYFLEISPWKFHDRLQVGGTWNLFTVTFLSATHSVSKVRVEKF